VGAVSLPIIIVPAAEADLLGAIAWYESNHSDPSFDFRLSLDAAFDIGPESMIISKEKGNP
jgi:hypothetical protein